MRGRVARANRDFKDFSTNEIRQGFGLYVLQGLCPSPRVELKFHSQQQDKVHGNDFVVQIIRQRVQSAGIVTLKLYYHAKIRE